MTSRQRSRISTAGGPRVASGGKPRGSGKGAAAARRVLREAGSAEARNHYERIAREYADQKDAAAEAARKLAALRSIEPIGTVSERKVLSGAELSELGASVTRDGRTLLYGPEGMDAPSIRDMASGALTHLGKPAPGVSVYDIRMSEDRTRIAYSWASGNEWQLRIIAAKVGATSRILLRTSGEVLSYKPHAWSPDGTWLVVELQRSDFTWQFARVRVRDGQVTALESTDWRRSLGPGRMRTSLSLTDASSCMPHSPSTRARHRFNRLIHRTRRSVILATDGSSRTVLTKSAGLNEDPVWSGDGSHVLFFSDRARTFDLWAVAVNAGKAQGQPFLIKRSIGSLYNAIPIGMTSGGLYYYTILPGALNQISIAELEAAEYRRIGGVDQTAGRCHRQTRPQWSPDGTRLAYLGVNNDVVVRTMSVGRRTEIPGRTAAAWRAFGCTGSIAAPRFC